MSKIYFEWQVKQDAQLRRQAWRRALRPIPEIFSWYKNNAVVGTVLVGVFLVVKGFVIARGDLTTALGILQYAGLTSVVIAGLLSSLPILAAAMLEVAFYRAIRAVAPVPAEPGRDPGAVLRWADPRQRWPLLWVTLGALMLSMLLTPVPYMVLAAVIGLLTGGARAAVVISEGRRGRRPGWGTWLIRAVRVVTGFVALFAVVAMLYNAWLPHEIVAFNAASAKAGQAPKHPDVGYVLADDPDGWITILLSGKHSIVRFRDSTVRSLTVCKRTPRGGLSDVLYASTAWEAGTRSLGSLSSANDQPCPPATH